MTNGEIIQRVFCCEVCEPIPEDDIIHVIFSDKNDSAIGFDLSWWNMEYKEPTVKCDLGVDCISRAQIQTELEMNASRYTIAKERGGMGQVEWSDQLIKVSDAVDIIRDLPSVTPQEPRKGHWIKIGDRGLGWSDTVICKCSECEYQKEFRGKFDGHNLIVDTERADNYCSNCGAKMVEPQENEEGERMIQIDDYDLPITAAEKIIRGVRPNNPTPLMKSLAKAVTGDEHASDNIDMFDLEEIKEIADYLIVYYEAHKNGD